MYISGVDCIAYNWLRGPWMDFYIAPPNCFEYGPGVERCLIKGGVAMDRGNTQELDTRIMGAEKEGVGILMTQ
jgi:hypothetical protein